LYTNRSPRRARCPGDNGSVCEPTLSTTQQALCGAPEEGLIVLLEIGVGRIEKLTPRDDYDIDARLLRVWRSSPKYLSNQSLSAISPHGVAKLLRGDNPESRMVGLVGRNEQRQVLAPAPLAHLEHAVEL
jgi:hypothetical protein